MILLLKTGNALRNQKLQEQSTNIFTINLKISSYVWKKTATD